MTKQDILDYFKDINHAYNDCTKYDTLKRMLDELQDPLADATKYFNSINELSETLGVSYDFIDEKIKAIIPVLSLQEPCEELDFVQPHKKVSVNLETSEWTPVSERFPEENGRYFVTVKLGYVTTAMWAGIAEDWDKVIAWMPFFPKPYKTSPTDEEAVE